MGNTAPIAYGGCTLAIAVVAGYASVPKTHQLYSAQGSFLGPAQTDRPLQCSVRETRSTRTFATRVVEISQRQDNGQDRLCLIMLTDFHVPEPASLMTYSKPRPTEYSSYDKCLGDDAWRQDLVDRGKVTERLAKSHKQEFGLMGRHFDGRHCPEGISSQNLLGMAKTTMTTQEDRSLTERTSADWWRCRIPVSTPAEQAAALMFILDAGMAFIGLTHTHRFIDDAGACSTLDFSLRVFVPQADLNHWHLREVKTIAGGNGRSYCEDQLWSTDGTMVANMTEQSIIRPKL